MLARGVMLSRGIIGSGADRVFTPDRSFYSWSHLPGLYNGVYGWIALGLFVLATAAVIALIAVRVRKVKQAYVLEPLKKQFVEDKISEEDYKIKKAILLKK